MKAKNLSLIIGVQALAAISVSSALTACVDSWDWVWSVKFMGDFVADDSVTPVPHFDLDTVKWIFTMYDNTVITYTMAMDTVQNYGISNCAPVTNSLPALFYQNGCSNAEGVLALRTSAGGQMWWSTPDLAFTAEKKVHECKDICTDKNDATGTCQQWYHDCNDVVKTVGFATSDIKSTATQVTFRTKGNGYVTVPGAALQHGAVTTRDENNYHEKAWLTHDKYMLPVSVSPYGVVSAPLTGVEGSEEIPAQNAQSAAEAAAEAARPAMPSAERLASVGAFEPKVVTDFNALTSEEQSEVKRKIELINTYEERSAARAGAKK